MKTLNKLLQRQFQKYCGKEEHVSEECRELFRVISESYDHYEKDRKMLERSIELSSDEMIELNNKLRKEAAELSKTNQELKTLLENIEDVFFSFDWVENKTLFISPSCEKIYGYPQQAFYQDQNLCLNCTHEQDKEIVLDSLRVLDSGQTSHIEYRIIHKNGETRWLQAKMRPTVDNAGQILRVDGLISDITSRKEKEKKLQHAEANLRNLLENTDTAYVLLDKHANILTFNSLANELSLKQTGDQLAEGSNYISVLPAHRRQDVYDIIQKILDDKKQVTYELNVTLTGDPGQWLQVSMHPIFNEEHKILGLSVAAVNITERKNTEQQIRASNERYELVTKATNDVIWDWDIVNNKVFRSANYEQVFGYTEKEGDLYGASWMNCIHEEDRERVLDNLLGKIKSPDTILWEDEYRYNRKNGEQAYVHDRGYIIYNEEKEPVRMVGAMRDVTWEKRLALEQEKITAELLRRNNDLEQFAYIISHNLRAPVTNILGISNLLREVDVNAEERRKCMDGLVLSVKKLDEVIIDLNHILQVRREITEKRERVRFSDVVENVKISISNLIQKENAIIFTEFNGIDEIVTLKSYLNSIFYNLILNSIKYRMPDACPIIRITGRKEEGRIFLSFRDNGLGIDLEAQGNKIFGLYKKFHFHTEGKGMGLYMVKTQVETLGGKISVKSKLNHGTEFLVELEA
ncbi:MAG: PAS domain-containing protein [Bacteroidetes bacterium]|nr:MAG: PAS domain-containing protein [Bacteroidota bacterium]